MTVITTLSIILILNCDDDINVYAGNCNPVIEIKCFESY